MADPSPGLASLRLRFRGMSHRLRLWSGLILFTFALLHLVNHALGLVSIEAMQAMQDLRLAVTHSLPGAVILLWAAFTHVCLGIAKFLRARVWRLGYLGAARLAISLLIPVVLIPFMLIRHIIGTSGVRLAFGIDVNYEYALWAMWPGEALNQAILIVLVWVHGCTGMHNWLVHKPLYRRTTALWYGIAVLIPALAYAGFVDAGRLRAMAGGYQNPFTPDQYGQILEMFATGKVAYGVILAIALAVWAALLLADRFRARITVTYADGPTIVATKGMTLLEVSRINRIPHASVCGGRARCSTCRVRVTQGLEHQPPADENELKVLRRVGAPANVRLACQLRPLKTVTVAALLPGNLESGSGNTADKYLWGVEQDVTLMFCDLRGFTKMSEGRLSFDVVFLLNQFLGRMAEAIEDSGGFVDKFMGDGIMAIFGMDTTPQIGAQQAIAAARAMGGDLDSLNQSLRDELPQPLAMGIGIHSGPAILGRIGARGRSDQVAALTALGETVNIASRLESTTKELEAQVVVSVVAMRMSGLTPDADPLYVEIRGLSAPMEVYALPRAVQLPVLTIA